MKFKRPTISEGLHHHRAAFARYIWLDLCRHLGLAENSGIADGCIAIILRRMEWCENDWPKHLAEMQAGYFPYLPDATPPTPPHPPQPTGTAES